MKKILTLFFLFLTTYMTPIDAEESPRILIKFPTRGRLEKFFSTLDLYYDNLSKEYPYHFLISCDQNDPVMNSPEAIARLDTYPNLSYYFGHSKSKIEACNADIEKHLNFDIILLASDDMLPRFKDFDQLIVFCMTNVFPDFDGVLQFDDGFQNRNLNTFPILGKKFYDRFGYLYNPNYLSLFCDNEMTDVSRMLNKVAYFDHLLFEHCHPSNDKSAYDEVYRTNDAHYWRDHDVYVKRRALRFDLKPSEIVNPL